MRTSLKYLLGFALILCATIFIISFVSGGVSADTHTWDGGGANALASTKENWVGDAAAPETDDDVLFNAAALPCTWDIASTMGTYTITSGYSGTITQSNINFGYGDFSIAGGIWTGYSSNTQTCSGSFVQTGGTVSNTLNLIMSGTGKTLTITGDPMIISLTIQGSITFTPDGQTDFRSITISEGASISISSGKTLIWNDYSGTTSFSNLGTISGAGTLRVSDRGNTITWSSGIISSYVDIVRDAFSSGNAIIQLSADSTITNRLQVFSEHATATVTLDLNGHPLSASSIIVSTRATLSNTGVIKTVTTTEVTIQALGTINSANINWVVGGNWDSSAGTWTPSDHMINMTGTSKTLKIGVSQTFWDLEISGRITILSTITVDDHLNISGHSTGIYWTYVIQGDNPNPLDIYGTAANAVVLDGTPDEFFIYCASNWINTTINPHPSAGTVWLPKRTTFYYPVHLPGVLHNLTVIPEPGSYANISLCDFGMGSFWGGCDVSDANTTFLWGGWQIGRAYDVSADGIRLGTYVIDANTCLTFYHDSWSAHNMTIVLNGPPIITPANVDSVDFLRHVVNEGVYYWLNYSSDQYVAWSLDSDALWISWSSPRLSGTPDYDQAGYYYADLTATNINGSATVHIYIHVIDVPYGQPTSLLMDIVPLIVLVMILAPIIGFMALTLRKKP